MIACNFNVDYATVVANLSLGTFVPQVIVPLFIISDTTGYTNFANNQISNCHSLGS